MALSATHLINRHNMLLFFVLVLAAGALLELFGLFIFGSFVYTQKNTLSSPSLKQLAQKHNISVGNFAIANHLQDKSYTTILTEQFNLAIIDNTPNWSFTDGGMRPSANEFKFDQMDYVVNFAHAHNMPIQAHHLLWGEQKWLPEWLKATPYTAAELQTIINTHINTVVTRYKGRIAQWTVVNEAFTRQQHLYGLNDWWADATHQPNVYIDNAFIEAHKADPHAVLILNDFNNESYNDVSNAMYTYIKDAKQRGIPIDAIGMQMHIDGTHPPKKDDVISNMRRFKDIGVDTYVTEFDVNMADVKVSSRQKDVIQADIYYEMARACIESNACKSFSILGITDAETWYSYMGITDSRPLPFDKNYNPKPAYFALRRAFE